MHKGISLHIGLNFVDPNAYGGWDGELNNCINDARAMNTLAEGRGFATTLLTDRQATASRVSSEIAAAARELSDGDYFLLTYSGHGSQVPDEENLENDGLNETWVLWDRQMIDNELYRLWGQFPAGVKITVISDSCHSGTIVRPFLRQMRNHRSRNREAILTSEAFHQLRGAVEKRLQQNRQFERIVSNGDAPAAIPLFRNTPVQVGITNYLDNQDLYRNIAILAGRNSRDEIAAKLLLISGCQDNQLSGDGPPGTNGAFSGNLLRVWNEGSYRGTFRGFHADILTRMPANQTPNFMTLGTLQGFDQERPFTISQATSPDDYATPNASPEPAITAPQSWGKNSEAPTFQIHKGANPYYYVEVTTDNRLFNRQQYGDDRRSDNFYATWNDTNVSNRLSAPSFELPTAAWRQLQHADRLYYRMGTTSSQSGWDNFMVTIGDSQYAQAPSIALVSSTTPVTPVDDPAPGPTAEGSDYGSVLSASVGRNGRNRYKDVLIVQRLLNTVPAEKGGPTSQLTEDGLYGDRTGTAIRRFQTRNGLSSSSSDYGVIRPDSPTLEWLTCQTEVVA